VQRLVDTLSNEEARLNALRDLRLLNTPPSESFDRLTRLASQLLKAPVSTVSLTDHDRQWFKSSVGLDITEIPREQAPCSYAIEGNGVFVVPDLSVDPRFIDSPLVKAGIRFYAGAPLFTRAGHGLGTICVVDDHPRQIDDASKRVLQDLAGMVMSQIELQNMIGRVDATTGMANQHQLFEDLEDLARTQSEGDAAIIIVDIMPTVQTAHTLRVLGSSQTDALMQSGMSLVRSNAGNSATLYHVGPMRCAVLLMDADPVERIANRIVDSLQVPILSDAIPINPAPAAGIYRFTPGEASPRDIFRRATGAVEDSRETLCKIAHYSQVHDERSTRTFAILSEFGNALAADDQLSLVYQPRFDLKSHAMVGVEALLRWQHPTLGRVSPGEFIPLVEQTAMARHMTTWVAEHAMQQAHAWKRAGKDLNVSINASALNLEERDFATRLLRAAQDARLEPHQMELEFTESAVARDTKNVIEQLSELRSQGMGIAIDDFGTGYSNLSYIQQLPVSVLKIDQAFVYRLITSAKDRLLVRTMIAMAHDLGYRVVAEGIETQDAYDILQAWGCDEGQGYLMSKPVVAAEVRAWARTPSEALLSS